MQHNLTFEDYQTDVWRHLPLLMMLQIYFLRILKDNRWMYSCRRCGEEGQFSNPTSHLALHAEFDDSDAAQYFAEDRVAGQLICRYDPSHRIKLRNFRRHYKSCILKQRDWMNYFDPEDYKDNLSFHSEEPPLPDDQHFMDVEEQAVVNPRIEEVSHNAIQNISHAVNHKRKFRAEVMDEIIEHNVQSVVAAANVVMEEEAQEFEDENTRLRMRIEELTQANQNLQVERTTIAAELEKREERIQELNVAVDSIKFDRDNYKKEREEVIVKLEDSEVKNNVEKERLRQDVVRAENKVRRLDAQLMTVEKERDALLAEVGQLKEAYKNLSNKLVETENRFEAKFERLLERNTFLARSPGYRCSVPPVSNPF